jgi:sigma-E factor negative regulatory protein RseB
MGACLRQVGRIGGSPSVAVFGGLLRLAYMLGLGLLLGATTARADEALDWLNRAASAARQLNYSGVYVYHHNGYVEVIRIYHRRDTLGEQEKIEVLDDTPRQFLRINNDMFCRLPDGKSMRLEKNATRRFFPALLPEHPDQLLKNYTVTLSGTDRVAGALCQVVTLEPRDAYRHGYNLWVDTRTGLPLKYRIVNSNGGVVSMFVFSEVLIGRAPDAQFFRQELIGKKITVDTPDLQAASAASAQWDVAAPPGYVRVQEALRVMPGKKLPVTHWIFSDGLSALSVFIEPGGDGGMPTGLAVAGSTGIYTRQLDGYRITTLGEVPNSALIATGNSIKKK